jgi:AraC family transcriptional regulator, melibiose operon regulatory protein
MKDAAHEPRLGSVANHERHFYASNRAFGRFGMRIFEPQVMPQPHWHGHIEANFATEMTMIYDVDGQMVNVPANRLVLFWAGIPHCLTSVQPLSPGVHKLCNIYLPLDAFLMMHHITSLQVALLGGGMIALPEGLCSATELQRWYADYRSGDFERTELVKMELNALFRRCLLEAPEYLRQPRHVSTVSRELSSAHIRHVIAMVRHVLENLERPLINAEITAVTGLHENYALSLFTRIMHLPLKQFVIRMRLMRARALLVESSMAIADVVEASGFASVSQFYAHFKGAYGVSPATLRQHYLRPEAS